MTAFVLSTAHAYNNVVTLLFQPQGPVRATRTLQYGPRSFAVAGPFTWNSLPAPLCSCHLTSAFRRDLKTQSVSLARS